jgi:hypothetical protein
MAGRGDDQRRIKLALKRQYHAALETLRRCVDQCPHALWDCDSDAGVTFWRVAYHTIFYAHFYLGKNSKVFEPWKKHRKGADNLGGTKRKPAPCTVYSRKEILEYWRLCDGMVNEKVEAMDLAAEKCGFWWYRMGKFEHQIVNIRHIQHHAAILSQRLRVAGGQGIGWVGKT